MFFCCATSFEDKTVESLLEPDPHASSEAEMADAALAAEAAVTLLQHPDYHKLGNSTPPVKISPIPEPPSSEYKVTIGKDNHDAPLGIDLETLGSMALILGISDGAIARYNQSAQPEHQVRVGDFVVDVNGACGDTKRIIRALSAASTLQMTLRRCVQFSICIDKRNYGTMGLELDYLSNGTSLMIKAIKQGPVQDWNAANSNMQLNREDRIISVNGTRGTASQLLSLCQEHAVLEMQVVRPGAADDLLA